MLLKVVINCYFLTFGIVSGSKHKQVENIVLLSVLVNELVVFGGFIIAFFQATETTYKIQLFACILFITMNDASKIFSRLRRKTLIYLSEELLNDSAKNLLYVNNRRLKKILLVCMYGSGIMIVGTVSSTAIFVLIAEISGKKIDYNDPGLYLVPYAFKFGKIESGLGYVMVNVFTFSLAIPCALSYLGSNLFFFCTLSNLVLQYKKMSEDFKDIVDSDITVHGQKLALRVRSSKYEVSKLIHQHVENKLRDFVRHQQHLHRYVTEFSSILKGMYSFFLAGFSITTILCISPFSQISMFTSVGLMYICASAFLGIGFLICSYIGETVKNMNELLKEELYGTHWYELCPQIRKSLLMLMTHLSKPIEIKAFNMFLINLNFFTVVLKKMYAALNMLFTINRK